VPLASLRCRSARFDDGGLNQKVNIATLKIRVYTCSHRFATKRGTKDRKCIHFEWNGRLGIGKTKARKSLHSFASAYEFINYARRLLQRRRRNTTEGRPGKKAKFIATLA